MNIINQLKIKSIFLIVLGLLSGPIFGYDTSFWFLTKVKNLNQESNIYQPIFQTKSFYDNSLDSPGLRQSGLLFDGVSLFSSYNSAYAWGKNDLEIWQGKGMTVSTSSAITYEQSWLRLHLAGLWWFSQNQDFNCLNPSGIAANEYDDYSWGLDRPQRFGNSSFNSWSLSDSEIRFFWSGWTLGISNENISLGPAQKNPMILSKNASGFPHLDVGTWGAIESSLGKFEGRFLWGTLQESFVFDENMENDNRMIAGGTLGYSPSIWPEITIGFNRYFISPSSTINTFKVFQFFLDGFLKNDRWFFPIEQGDDDVDQVVSLTGQLMLPQFGLEVYGEWAKNDHSGVLIDMIFRLDHTQAYVLGINKIIEIDTDKSVVFSAEISSNELSVLDNLMGTGPWYRHGPNPQGYTQLGQIIGAGMGPGSSSIWSQLALVQKEGNFISLGFERLFIDNDYFYSKIYPSMKSDSLPFWNGFNMQLITSISGAYVLPILKFDGGINIIWNANRDWIFSNNVWNWNIYINTKVKLP